MNDDYLRIFNHVKQRLEKDRKNLEVGLQLSESEILSTIEKTEEYWDIKLSVGEKEKMLVDLDALLRISVLPINKIVNKGWKPWLHLRSEEQKGVFYSDRYKQYLLNKAHLPERIINEIFDTSDKILDCLANPLSDDNFKKKGLVIGHVQSGKTANYIGLINRAADVGYKLIILIAGVHNNLRSQTQNRINEGFIGFDSLKNEPVGVGGDSKDPRNPISFTNTVNDFKKSYQQAMNFDPIASKVPVILVIKKNSSTLKNIIEWLKADSKREEYVNNYPVLLIDDEADNASINTKKNPDEATRINEQIRKILRLFNKISYIGYTATPFANIFIDPHNEIEMLGDDLFPSDFIVSLEAPDNYIGSKEIFGANSDQYIRTIDDTTKSIPIPIPKDYVFEELPYSLYVAVNLFLLSVGIKDQRNISTPHTSMLVNITHRTAIQNQIKLLISDYKEKLIRTICFEAFKPLTESLKNKKIRDLYELWKVEYNQEGDFQDIIRTIAQKRDLIKVSLINSQSKDNLDYDEYKDSGGLHVIAVGGYSLSRGFTLEGLTISYFLRNSIMYDTLLQMGRWFGYRNNYKDLCRVFLLQEAAGWYKHISGAIEELRDEVKILEYYHLTPKEYGLKVRSDPDGLLVTAKNKMWHGTHIIEQRNYSERLVENRALSINKASIINNHNVLSKFVASLPSDKKQNDDYLWLKVDISFAEEFIANFENHPMSADTDKINLMKYINLGYDKELSEWDVYIPKNKGDGDILSDFLIELELKKQTRTFKAHNLKEGYLSLLDGGGRIVRIWDEEQGLTKEQISEAKKILEEKNIKQSARLYRELRERPLLVIKILQIAVEGKSTPELKSVVAYGISFPKSQDVRNIESSVANKIYMDILNKDDEDEELEIAD